LILQRLFALAAAVAAVAAAAVVCVIAAAFALYALARLWLTPAGAGAVVALAFATVAAAVAVVATRKVPPPETAEEAPLAERLIQMAKARPLMSAGAAAALVTVLVRNPAVLSAIVSAVIAGATAKPGAKSPEHGSA
jgi:hypothetical protein